MPVLPKTFKNQWFWSTTTFFGRLTKVCNNRSKQQLFMDVWRSRLLLYFIDILNQGNGGRGREREGEREREREREREGERERERERGRERERDKGRGRKKHTERYFEWYRCLRSVFFFGKDVEVKLVLRCICKIIQHPSPSEKMVQHRFWWN